MKYLYGLAILCGLVLWSSCRNDFETIPSTGNLEFSRDTVYLDTVFTNIGSSTYNLRVYNRSNEDINIPSVRLGRGQASNYRLNVDGLAGKEFEDVQVLAKDSIFIFVETTVDIADQTGGTDFVYEDQILFDAGGNEQHVDLITLIQDAVFLFPDLDSQGIPGTIPIGEDPDGNPIEIEGFVLSPEELTFTNEKPYVIYGYAAVASGETLTIEAGARIHFHRDSGILVADEGSIQALGLPSTNPELMENEIIFEGDRLEPGFADIPGQWDTILLTPGSTNNIFNHTTIKNSAVGLLVNGNDQATALALSNVQIYNSANFGLLARAAIINGENVVINNSGISSLACQFGGIYNFNHSTFANYWTNSFRNFPAVQLDNGVEEAPIPLVEANFTNCIIYGSEQRELGFGKIENTDFNFNFTNSLIKFEDPNGDFEDDPNYDFSNDILYTNSVLNAEPTFQNVNLNDFNIEQGNSGAEGIGLNGIGLPQDLNGTPRDNTPDAGAYEAIIFIED
ncbi:MAG: hypothetical protein K0U54_14025 [Bacteroidetes bacterium]|nr:hypothetical protein [Bacteroidota bacterium]